MIYSLVILILSITTTYAHSTGRTFNPSRLNQDSRERLAIMLMELATEYESLNHKPPEVKKYSLLNKLFHSILIDRAYAETKGAFNGTEFQEGYDKDRSKEGFSDLSPCIYGGGWPSFAKKNNGDIECLNPSSFPNSEVAKIYLSVSSLKGRPENTDQCKSKNKISCNPAIFGYKDISRKLTFCVEDDQQKSSSTCMDLALDKKWVAGADSAHDRVKWLINAQAEKTHAFENMFQHIFQLCLCPSAEKEVKTIPTKSCFSLITMVSEPWGCVQYNETLNSSDMVIFNKISQLSLDYLKGREKDAEKLYTQMIEEERELLKDEFKLICDPISLNKPSIPDSPSTESNGPTIQLDITSGSEKEIIKVKVSELSEKWKFEWVKKKKIKLMSGMAGDSDDNKTPKLETHPISNEDDAYSAAYEVEPYTICVTARSASHELTKCHEVDPENKKEDPPTPTPKTKPVKLAPPPLPQLPPANRKGVDFSRGGII